MKKNPLDTKVIDIFTDEWHEKIIDVIDYVLSTLVSNNQELTEDKVDSIMHDIIEYNVRKTLFTDAKRIAKLLLPKKLDWTSKPVIDMFNQFTLTVERFIDLEGLSKWTFSIKVKNNTNLLTEFNYWKKSINDEYDDIYINSNYLEDKELLKITLLRLLPDET